MKGTRVYPDENGWFNGLLKPGEYVKVDPKRMADGSAVPEFYAKHYPYWMGCAPNGHACSLGAHTITEHENGTITVSPSIRISTTRSDPNGKKFDVQLWHGYLEKGVWRDA